MLNFPSANTLNSNTNPHWQVETFNTILLNIMSNFIPNKTHKIEPKDAPWITQDLRRMINRQKRTFKNYKRHGYLNAGKIRVDQFRNECNLAVQLAKQKSLNSLGLNITDINTIHKSYWKVINKLFNKCKDILINY